MDRPRTSKGFGRSIGLAAILGSLLIHAVLAALVLQVTKPARLRPLPPTSTEIEVREVETPPARKAPALSPSSKPTKVVRRASGGARGAQVASTPAKGTPAKGEAPKASQTLRAAGQSYAGDVPAALDLTLHANLETASPGGETVHNRPGEIEPEEARPSLAQHRIDEWIEDDTSRRRVDKGLVDDWFMRLDKSLEHALDEAPATKALADGMVGKLFENYAAAAGRYGATGTPAIPSDSKLELPAGAVGPLGPALGTPGTFKLQVDSAGLDPWAVIEVNCDHGGKLSASRLLESSGNRDFNSHVLRVVAVGLVGIPEAPDGGQGIHPEGTRSVWRITGHLTAEREVKHGLSAHDAWALPLSAAGSLVGLGGGGFDEVTGHISYQDFTHPHLHCKVELLQVY